MTLIYKPKGKAAEYSELACNLYNGCRHGCTYCYCPGVMRMGLEQWSAKPQPKKDVLGILEHEARKMQGEERQVLLCFMSDPYQSDEAAETTRQALLIFERYRFANISVLTKGGMRAAQDFQRLAMNRWKFGSTIVFDDDKFRQKYEPGAAPIKERYEALELACNMGITAWVSIEPVIDADQALLVIARLKDFGILLKIGKLNHKKTNVDYYGFAKQAQNLLKGARAKVYWKLDTRKYLPNQGH